MTKKKKGALFESGRHVVTQEEQKFCVDKIDVKKFTTSLLLSSTMFYNCPNLVVEISSPNLVKISAPSKRIELYYNILPPS